MTRRPICLLACLALAGCSNHSALPTPATVDDTPAWQVVARDLPAAFLSVDGASAKDLYAVGSDKGAGPLVVHFDGKAWTQLHTGQRGDLWWVHAFPDGSALMGGASANVLRLPDAHGHFERLPTPGLGRQTVYGIWGASPRDFYAVGSASGRTGFIWHYDGTTFHEESLPLDLPRLPHGEVPGFFKVWGRGDDVWVVGAAGTVLHRKGTSSFAVIPTTTKDTLFTIHGTGDRWLTVGGGSNGVAIERGAGPVTDVSPKGAGVVQGVFTSDADGDWVSGERGMIYTRRAKGAPWQPVEHDLALPVASSLHAIFVDSAHEIWSVGGNVLTPALDAGMLVHYGKVVPALVLEDEAVAPKAPAPTCPANILEVAKDRSIARRWDEQALAAIRKDLPRPTVHARNLFHLSAAMWDAWAAYDATAEGVFVRERQHAPDVEVARKTAISYAAFDILKHRYEPAVGGAVTVACLRAVMQDLGYDSADQHDQGDDPIALGNRIAKQVITRTADDGSNEAHNYADPSSYTSPNAALVFDNPGTTLVDPNVWQPINLSVAATQNGIVLASGVQGYIGAQWGDVTPFAMKRASESPIWHHVPQTPRVDNPLMRRWLTEVIDKAAAGDPANSSTIDISPAAYGHNSLGANDGKGWSVNPVTGKPYEPKVVLRADFARVMAEFWADGPDSETPPGHWNVIANSVADTPDFPRKLFGKGAPQDPLSWDVHVYLALNGAVHDAAIAAWGSKRLSLSSRPIVWIRWMGAKGQSSDPKGPSYDPEGLPLVPGLIEVITKESSAPGQRHARLAFYVGQVAVRGWLGEPGDRATQDSGTDWVRAIDWIPYQRRTFVTPAFPGYISGHSTFSRAGAEALTALTGSPYFPGGYAEFVARPSSFLTFEKGPIGEVRLEWAAYADASDEAGQSRIWGGIHIEPDDFVGRKMGYRIGKDAAALATRYFNGTVASP
jgi:hypothetical protein